MIVVEESRLIEEQWPDDRDLLQQRDGQTRRDVAGVEVRIGREDLLVEVRREKVDAGDDDDAHDDLIDQVPNCEEGEDEAYETAGDCTDDRGVEEVVGLRSDNGADEGPGDELTFDGDVDDA